MTLEFTVGINIAGERRTVTVSAEDALIAALKVKQRNPQATINYVRRSNRRGISVIRTSRLSRTLRRIAFAVGRSAGAEGLSSIWLFGAGGITTRA
jgi:hypothetical protein